MNRSLLRTLTLASFFIDPGAFAQSSNDTAETADQASGQETSSTSHNTGLTATSPGTTSNFESATE